MEKEKISKLSIVLGFIILIIQIPLYQKPSLATIFLGIIAIYLILTGIFNHKELLSIILGIILLIVSIISIYIQLGSSLEIILFIILSILCIILGTLTYLGYISKKWIQ